MALTQTLLTDELTEIYQSQGTNAVVVAYFCNASSDPVQLDIFLAQSGATSGNIIPIYTNITITSEDTYILDTEKIILDDGESMFARCSANSAVFATVNTIGV